MGIRHKDSTKTYIILKDSLIDFTPYLLGKQFEEVYEFKNLNDGNREDWFRTDFRTAITVGEFEFSKYDV